jgi:dGTPase
VRDSIDLMIRDLLTNTKKNLKKQKIKSIKDIGIAGKPLVSFSEKIQNSEREIKSFLRTKMYQNNSVLKKKSKGQSNCEEII